MNINLTPEFLASLRQSAENARKHQIPLRDMAAAIIVALLDRIKELEEQRLAEAVEDMRREMAGQTRGNHGTPLTYNGKPVTFMGEQVVVERKEPPADPWSLAEHHERTYGYPHPLLDLLRRKP